MDTRDLKRAVRERDGLKCTQCGMTNDQHLLRFGRQLDVHRLAPGSAYTLDGCVTLCKPCHGPKPKARYRPRIPLRQVGIRVPPPILTDLEYIGRARSMDLSTVIRLILSEHIGAHVQRARVVLDERQEGRRAKGEPPDEE